VHRLLGEMHELAMILRGRRMKHGSLELTMPEVKVDLDRDGRVTGAHLVKHTESHQIIEEFMLAANEAVAQMLKDNELFFLRRVHAAPDPRKLLQLTEFVRDLGFETESLESRFAIQDLLREVHGTPQEHAVNYAVLRSMQKAVYSPEEEGHYALASECYCHFTSPIRRYPDLTVHRLLTALLRGKPPKQDLDEHFVLGEHCSQREQRAEQAERELTKVKLLNYMSQRIGEEMVGIITGVEEFGLFVQGVELPAEGLIHVSALSDDYYRFDRAAHTLSGHRTGNSYRLGDAVRVEVARVDIDRRELDFRLVGRIARASHGKPAKAGGSRAAGDRPDQKARRGGGKASAAARGSKPPGGGKQGAKQKGRGKKRKGRG
jgi:ribonuclease R